MKTDEFYLEHILEAIGRTQDHAKGVSYARFETDRLIQGALFYELQIIGEAARHLSTETKRAMKEIDWISVVGMRNKLVHEYFQISLKDVWTTLQNDLPDLREIILQFLG